jgi:hypothetical protein
MTQEEKGEKINTREAEYAEWCLWNPIYQLEIDYSPDFQKHNIPYFVG